MDDQSWQALRVRLGDEYLSKRVRAQADRMVHLRGQGRGGFHLENMPWFMKLVKAALQVTGLYGLGQRNALQIGVRENRVVISELAPALAGLRLLQISDLHLDGYHGLGGRIAAALSGQRFDVCLLTGDYRFLDVGTYRHIESELAALLPALACRLGIYGILGNHDFVEMVPILEAAGVRMLLNEAVPLPIGGASLWLVGLDDPHFYGLHDFNRGLQDVPRAATCILLAHSPEVIREASVRRFALYLTGHTHGGQICLPGGWPAYVNARCPRRYVGGAWEYNGMPGYTSYGAGASGVFVRYFCAPEIVIHELATGLDSIRKP